MKKKIKAILFDIGGVLWLGIPTELKLKGGVHELIAKKLGLFMDQYFDSIDTTYARSIIGEINEKECLQIMARNLKTTPKRLRKLYVDAYKKNYVLNKDLLKVAEKLKKEGYKVAILSDQWAVSRDAFVIKKFYKIFDPVLISCEVKVRKPTQEAYWLALKKLKVKPEECVFIDNQEWNTGPAKDMGLRTILFRNNEQVLRELNKILK